MKLKQAKKEDQYTQDSIPPDWDSMFSPLHLLPPLVLVPSLGLLISLFLERVLLKGLACYHFCVSTQDGSEDSETTHLCTRSVMSSLIPRLHVVAGE